eukprot:766516-Hanusia_phi.AAC.1
MFGADLGDQSDSEGLPKGKSSQTRDTDRAAPAPAQTDIHEPAQSDLLLGCHPHVLHMRHPVRAGAAAGRLA